MSTENQEQKVEAGNKLIAEFMGHLNKDGYIDYDLHKVYRMPIWLSSYHTSWNWLMSVVEKIESIVDSGCVSIASTECKIMVTYDNIIKENGETKIEAVYKAVIQFITFYNTTITK